jgi:hypothetical protein
VRAGPVRADPVWADPVRRRRLRWTVLIPAAVAVLAAAVLVPVLWPGGGAVRPPPVRGQILAGDTVLAESRGQRRPYPGGARSTAYQVPGTWTTVSSANCTSAIATLAYVLERNCRAALARIGASLGGAVPATAARFGIGSAVPGPGTEIAGVAGNAEVPGGVDSWFVGYAPTIIPAVAVAVVVEDTGSPADADDVTIVGPLAAATIRAALRNGACARGRQRRATSSPPVVPRRP